MSIFPRTPLACAQSSCRFRYRCLPRLLCLLPLLALMPGCAVLAPSNNRDWSPDQAVLPYAELGPRYARLRNIRYCQYRTTDDYTVHYYDKTFDLQQLDSLDFIVIPFRGMPQLAHTMLSFGFGGRDYVCVSVEIRREKGETYAPLKGMLRQFELMYVVGDERDLIKLRTNYRLDDVYVYRVRATPEQIRAMFTDVMNRVNKLAVAPEFYNTLTNNCTNNIVRHINRLAPNRVPWDLRILLPGRSDEYAYELGLLDTDVSFEETKLRARINYLANRYASAEDFSQKIRQLK